MERAIIFAGFGGQGILFAGQVLAQAAMTSGLEVFWIPSYGPEMRGGTASCTVIVGDEPIGSPVVDQAQAAVVLNAPSLARFGPLVAPGGLLVVNASLVDARSGRADIVEVRVPCTTLARDAGDDRLVSMVALGALVGSIDLVTPEAVFAAVATMLKGRAADLRVADRAAIEVGLREVGRPPPGGDVGTLARVTATTAGPRLSP